MVIKSYWTREGKLIDRGVKAGIGTARKGNKKGVTFMARSIKGTPRWKGERATCPYGVWRYELPGGNIEVRFITEEINGEKIAKPQTMERVDQKPIYYHIHCPGYCEGEHKGPVDIPKWNLPSSHTSWFNTKYYNEYGPVQDCHSNKASRRHSRTNNNNNNKYNAYNNNNKNYTENKDNDEW